MIRINLLPVRAAKKKETLRFQLTVAGLATFLVFAVSMAVYIVETNEAAGLKGEIKSGEEELNSLKAKIGELSKIKEQKRIVEEKLRIVESLEKARTGPTDLFKKISDAVPEKAWLASLKDDPHVVTLRGYAASDETVADFMRGLEKHKDLGRVELEVAQRTTEKETGAEVVSFIIKLEKPAPAAQPQPQPQKGK